MRQTGTHFAQFLAYSRASRSPAPRRGPAFATDAGQGRARPERRALGLASPLLSPYSCAFSASASGTRLTFAIWMAATTR